MKNIIFLFIIPLVISSCSNSSQQENLKSWNNINSKKEIVQFVNNITNPNSDQFIPIKDRIAVFDNDGTLWSEKPLYSHFYGVFARVEERIKEDPTLAQKEPFKSLHQFIITKDIKNLGYFMNQLEKGEFNPIVGELMGAPYDGMTVTEFNEWNKKFFKTWKNPIKNKTINELTYLPMKELITYLQKNDFKVYIFTADEGDFLKLFSEDLYNIPAKNVFGSSTALKYKNGQLYRTSKGRYVDNWGNKAALIHQTIGKKPIFAAGNSNGDFEMLEYVNNQSKPHMSLLIHHTDEQREFKYDKHTEKVLPYAKKHNYNIIDMKKDWSKIY
ncbi:HAD family hydrolase [Flammeovirga kamogawensis]|uniref:Haloacid dehalogenase-like hydrolase n=1 Tax=Flammeovirga kamogawensis TaxID=373891 RepID=A0ABX8H084_9BACT|nr:HAD family hydrolase [Flammeovirga kamogawensis]MBB6459449.1 phosphoglycolate phosphatase-like HAD superfamily hydrolase [Flammeovirga kamogawensis]QWG09002.1 haloacid dehalogenase-like hydrolase [Flammeovirga kamogawensis]TRX67290.1 haloacid dehalogenase-like hydrolase [Flammeovirga kamogawensis]